MNTRKNAAAQSIVLACALTVTACAGGASPPDPTESSSPVVQESKTTTPSPSPTKPEYEPATAKGPAKNVALPEYSALAHKNTTKGAKAFAEYYFQLMNYVGETNNADQLKKVTSRQCQLCGEGIIDPADKSKAIDQWQVGGNYDFTVIDSYKSADNLAIVTLNFHINESETYTIPDDPIAHYEATTPSLATLQLKFDNGWVVLKLLVADDES
ncbi:DUF6318 family protein [Glutamicibacter sp. AOP33-2CA-4]|uniref:DUF6318 family protein n=1 Tax=Glutamicibacter sp. AOP33-2CA-4 TaxID=3457690 RepID=UPI0040338528